MQFDIYYCSYICSICFCDNYPTSIFAITKIIENISKLISNNLKLVPFTPNDLQGEQGVEHNVLKRTPHSYNTYSYNVTMNF